MAAATRRVRLRDPLEIDVESASKADLKRWNMMYKNRFFNDHAIRVSGIHFHK